MEQIKLNVKVQVIYYQTPENELGLKYATRPTRITQAEAHEILTARKIDFLEVLKVKTEDKKIQLPLNEFENYVIEQK